MHPPLVVVHRKSLTWRPAANYVQLTTAQAGDVEKIFCGNFLDVALKKDGFRMVVPVSFRGVFIYVVRCEDLKPSLPESLRQPPCPGKQIYACERGSFNRHHPTLQPMATCSLTGPEKPSAFHKHLFSNHCFK